MSEPPWPSRTYYATLVVLFACWLLLPLADRVVGIDRPLPLHENRTPAPLPQRPHSWDALKTFPKEFEAYWNDAFGFRSRLIFWQALASYHLGVSGTPGVTIGKKPWLFFDGDFASEQHTGRRLMSAAELDSWRTHLQARHDWLEHLGAHFLFVVAPDKQSVYSEELPNGYTNARTTPLDQLVNELAAHSTVDVLDLRGPLRAAKRDRRVFCSTDSHWNDYGGFVAYQALIERLARWYPRLAALPLSAFYFQLTRPWSGDLAEFLSLGGVISEKDRDLFPLAPLAVRELPGDGANPPASRHFVRTKSLSAPSTAPRVVVFHDSFFLTPEERRQGNPAQPWSHPPSAFRLVSLLGERFSEAAFTWQYEFDPDLVKREHPDLVIEEEAERMLINGPVGPLPPSLR